ncbi:MAG: trans-aconitate 2-methyltransferase [Parvibaculum sp.]|uniref:trans-aconitate 2-methyltransferase n=1 Tax=Parvibaculum sp. TaxID=2024848 RepID=UPI0025F8F8E9|nr:trans-aconitate 2-methyltransferase [Parvibaculum sp.]MCE9650175.1 trans-aconitate 2-methyltransferase [Parvibaculum sp.]
MEDWSARQYTKFEDERTRPARDLLAQVPLGRARDVVDVGCGPGNSTELLVERYPDARVTGMDSSPDMLTAARQRLPGVDFVEGDAANWKPRTPADLIYGNAVFQWLPDHDALFPRLMGELNPGGVLALQMPDNRREPSHIAMGEAALAGPWSAAYGGREPGRETLPPPSHYYDLLAPLSARVDIWHTIYYHPLADAAAIVEWVKGTGLRPYLDPLSETQRSDFLADYQARIARAYPPLTDGRVLLRFPRLFIVATKS